MGDAALTAGGVAWSVLNDNSIDVRETEQDASPDYEM